MRETICNVQCGGLAALYRRETESGVAELLLLPAGQEKKALRADCAPEPLVQAKLVGDDYGFGFSQGRTLRSSATVTKLRFVRQWQERSADEICIYTQLAHPAGLQLTHKLALHTGSPTAELSVTAENTGETPLTLELLSSFALGSLSPFSEGLAPGTLKIHRMRSTWSAEGRLISEPAEELQLEPSWQKFSQNSVRFGSVGSFPVRGYVPFAAVEDTAHGITWAAAPTQGSSWQIELCRRDYGLSMSGGLADREFGHWTKTLAPGERFASPKAVATVVRGGVDAAAQALAENLRRSLRLPAAERAMPVLFNEFCATWGVPTEQSVLQQVAALRGKGVGVFVIDAGWYDDCATETASNLGHWQLSKKAFPHGLKPVVDVIHDAGMQAGIWFEFEIAGRDAKACFEHTEWLLHRDGVPLTSGNRRWWDMRKPEVQDYLAQRVIGFLRENKFDYVKVDYNDTIGIGCDSDDASTSQGEGLRQQIEASQAFFARLRWELPEVTLEICASGGHRLCHSFLELGCMASFSDAHECDEIPIIAANMHRMMLPRQSQIWAVVKASQPLQKLYYQLCSGLLGRLCLSGEPEKLSPAQWALIREGIAFYHQAAPVIDEGFTQFYGPKVLSYRWPEGWQCIVRKGRTHTLVVLHTFHNAPDTMRVPVQGQICAELHHAGIQCELSDGQLAISGLSEFDGTALLLENA